MEKIKLRCDSAGNLCTALFNKTKTNAVSFEKKKKSKCNRRKSMVHQERKEREKTLHTRNMDTWLLLYPTTKACVSLKFYTFIFLNIQFLNVFTEPAMRY